MLEVDENLDDLAQILGTQTLYERLADLFCKKFVQRLRVLCVSKQAFARRRN